MGPPDPFLPTPSHPDSGYKNHWEPTCLLFPQGQGSSERKLSFWWGLPPAFFSDLPGFFRLCECELLYYPFSIPCLYAGPHLRVPGAQQSPSPFISWPALPPLPLISSQLWGQWGTAPLWAPQCPPALPLHSDAFPKVKERR